jgi:hypothetical protein
MVKLGRPKFSVGLPTLGGVRPGWPQLADTGLSDMNPGPRCAGKLRPRMSDTDGDLGRPD